MSHKKLVKKRRQSPARLSTIFFVLDGCRQLLEDMVNMAHDEWYSDIIFQVISTEYKRVRLTGDDKWDFGLDSIRHMMHTMYVDNFSRPSNSKPISGCGIAMQTVGNKQGMQYNCCKGVGHLIQDCATHNAKKYRYGVNQHIQPQRSQHAPRKGTGGEQKWQG